MVTIATPRIKQHKSAGKRLLGPRSKREKMWLEKASKLYQCPQCRRCSVFKSCIIAHMRFSHPDQSISDENLNGFERQPFSCRRLQFEAATSKPKVVLYDIEEMEKFPVLSEVLDSNGAELHHDLDLEDIYSELTAARKAVNGDVESDQDTEDSSVTSKRSPDSNKSATSSQKSGLGPLFKCYHCQFTSPRPVNIKTHLRSAHPDDSWLSMLDVRKKDSVVYFQCFGESCHYFADSKDSLCEHYDQFPSHPPSFINFHRLKEIDIQLDPLVNRIQSSSKSKSPRKDKSKSKSPRRDISVIGYQKYNVRLHKQVLNFTSHAQGYFGNNVDNLCRYCPEFWHKDPTEVNLHINQCHPNAYPCAVNVKSVVGKQRAEMYMCPDLACPFKDRMCKVIYDHVLECHYADEFECMKELPGVVFPPDEFSGIRYSRKSKKMREKQMDGERDVSPAPSLSDYTSAMDTYPNSEELMEPNTAYVTPTSVREPQSNKGSSGKKRSRVSSLSVSDDEPMEAVIRVGSGRTAKAKAAFKINKALHLPEGLQQINFTIDDKDESDDNTRKKREPPLPRRRQSGPKPPPRPKVIPNETPADPKELEELESEIADLLDVPEPDRAFLANGRWKSAIDESIPVKPTKKRFLCYMCNKDVMSLARGKAHHLLQHKNLLDPQCIIIVDKAKQRLRKKTRVYLCVEKKCPFYCKDPSDLETHLCGTAMSEQPFFTGGTDPPSKDASPKPATVEDDDGGCSESHQDEDEDNFELYDTEQVDQSVMFDHEDDEENENSSQGFTSLLPKLSENQPSTAESESDGEVADPPDLMEQNSNLSGCSDSAAPPDLTKQSSFPDLCENSRDSSEEQEEASLPVLERERSLGHDLGQLGVTSEDSGGSESRDEESRDAEMSQDSQPSMGSHDPQESDVTPSDSDTEVRKSPRA